MNWGSWSNFIDMGGRGFYVWCFWGSCRINYVWVSYFITLVCIVLELGLLARQKRTLWQRLTQFIKLNKQG